MSETFAERVAYLHHAWTCGNRDHVLAEIGDGRTKGSKSRAYVAALMHRMIGREQFEDASCFARTIVARIGDTSLEYLTATPPQEL